MAEDALSSRDRCLRGTLPNHAHYYCLVARASSQSICWSSEYTSTLLLLPTWELVEVFVGIQAYKAYKLGGKVSELLYSPALYGIDLSAQNMPKPRARSSPMMAVVGNTLWLFGGVVEVCILSHLQCLVQAHRFKMYAQFVTRTYGLLATSRVLCAP